MRLGELHHPCMAPYVYSYTTIAAATHNHEKDIRRNEV